MERKPSASGKNEDQPIDKALGLLGACMVVVIGSWNEVQPETILIRAIVVAVVTMILARVAMGVLKVVSIGDED